MKSFSKYEYFQTLNNIFHEESVHGVRHNIRIHTYMRVYAKEV